MEIVIAVNDQGDSPSGPATPDRGYRGVRITPPPRLSQTMRPQAPARLEESALALPVSPEKQARILTGAALLGVILIVLLHEFGHWLAGFAVTGTAPDFYVIAVRQKVEQFSAVGGVVTWGAGPTAQVAVLWAMILLASGRGRRSPRLLAMAGGSAIFSAVVYLAVWVFAALSSADSWGNDLPRVATFMGSGTAERLWMHLLSAVYSAAILAAVYRWWTLVKDTGKPALHGSPAVIGAIEGGILVLIATLFVTLSI
ncbi:MAG: hypothetical protein O3B04_01740 [Chloroflexi bacterium]|nr:hypothetical protein [Chloroflexota bacterium]